ncbi:hypothetical protein V5799_002735 [Amblyomma americanum]|uniref:Uncharacterized protein n=1 Tax=Amblyomma americanum TaxID=6943 RepID=A0AAQ4DAZ3_AMBAM
MELPAIHIERRKLLSGLASAAKAGRRASTPPAEHAPSTPGGGPSKATPSRIRDSIGYLDAASGNSDALVGFFVLN